MRLVVYSPKTAQHQACRLLKERAGIDWSGIFREHALLPPQ